MEELMDTADTELEEVSDEELEALESEFEQSEEGYLTIEAPEIDDEEDSGYWYAHLPTEHNGELDWENLVVIGGKLPTTSISRKAIAMVPARFKNDRMLAFKESQENLLRLCIDRFGDKRFNQVDLRGSKLDAVLGYKQIQMVNAFFAKLTEVEEDEMEAFLGMAKTGRKPKK